MNAIIVSALLGVVMMFAGIVLKKTAQIQGAAILGILALLGTTLVDLNLVGADTKTFYNMIELNAVTAWFNVLITFCALA